MTVTLRVFFFGLIAFVKQPDGLTVALVNAVTPHAASGCASGSASQCPFHAHSPFLTILPNLLSGCSDSMSFPGLCAWDLKGKTVSFPNPTTPGVTYADTRGRFIPMVGAKHRLPGDANEAQDFSWVPVMADVTGKTMTVSQNNLTPGTSKPTIASLKLTGGAVQACHLADLDLSGQESPVESACAGDCIHTFRFESIDGTIQGSAKQALADGVMASFNLEVDPQNPYVTINIGGELVKVPPVSCSVNQQTGMCVDVAMTNMPAHDDTCPSTGMDFALLFELVDGVSKDVCPRLVPHRTSESRSAWKLAACSSPVVDSLLSGMASVSPDSRPVCPMGTYGG